ncbi:hypothetical protein Y032_0007g3490 [Ancylostoma ceylanicum]|uniref:SCP domain-containing protein n=2 Tax=Ancylostoma ceylanicum TaxID=53326 RepID=A0A016VMR8_9BILA|nr:hypothetical protein Y032_0007g3490 [Ancylostoma ceylanicum]
MHNPQTSHMLSNTIYSFPAFSFTFDGTLLPQMMEHLLIILCLVRSAFSAVASCTGGAFTNDQRDRITSLHNQIRSNVAKGVSPNWIGCMSAGSNIYEMSFEKKGKRHRWKISWILLFLATKIRYVSNKICALKLDDLLEDTIDQWYMPVFRYGVNDANNMYSDPRLESFANMVFYKNTAVGCHYAECPGITGAKKVITCMYNNVITPNDVIYPKGFPCRSDADCSYYASSTCDLNKGLCGTTVNPQPKPQPTPCPPTTGGMCSNTEMTDTIRRKILQMHNWRRSQLALGNIKNGKNSYNCPTAANMYKMKYDCDLENLALAYAKQCTLAPSNTPTEGENVHSAPYNADQYAAAKAAVQAWWSQIFKNGLNQKMLFIANLRDKPNAPTAFTQMGWAQSYRIGCAVVQCGGNWFSVCRYSAKGNILNQQIYQVGPPCSACTTSCLGEGLCATP